MSTMIEVPQNVPSIVILILVAIVFGMALRVFMLNKTHKRKNKKNGKDATNRID